MKIPHKLRLMRALCVKEKVAMGTSKDHTFTDRLISVLVSLIFTVPTVSLVWFGLGKQLALLGNGSGLSLNTFLGAMVILSVVAFVFPAVFPSILGAIWRAIIKVQKLWQW